MSKGGEKPGWVTKRLGDVTTKIGSGATPLGGEEAYQQSGISLIRSLNVHDWGFKEARLAYIDDAQAAQLSNVVVEPNDVLLNITGASIARCCLAPRELLPARVNQHVSIIRPIKERVWPPFLHYLLISKTYKERLLHTGEDGGSTRQAITKAQLQEFLVEFPESLPEQHRIVSILDKAFDAIATAKANAEKNLQNARALLESRVQAVFSRRGEDWARSSLGQVYDVRDGTHDSPKYQATGYPLITSKNLGKEGLCFDEVKLISEEDYRKINQRSGVDKGDVLFAMIGTIGNPTIVGIEPQFAIKNVALFKIPGGQSGAFLKYYLSSGEAISKMLNEAKGTTQRFVGLGYLRDFPISLPPLRGQLEIVAGLDRLSSETRRLESLYRQKLAALDSLKQSLLHQAFSGAL